MTNRQTPPGLKSKLDVVVVKPFGPHHCERCLGSVHAANTSSRGASNSRTPMIDRGSVSRSSLLVAAMFPVLLLAFRLRFAGLQFLQIGIEAIEALLEKAAIVLKPIVDFFQGTWLDPARPPLRLARTGDQAGSFQDLQVLGHSRHAHGERLRQISH